MNTPNSGTDPKLLDKLINTAKNHVMTPEERYAQRRSFVRGMCPSRTDYGAWCAMVDKILPAIREPSA